MLLILQIELLELALTNIDVAFIVTLAANVFAVMVAVFAKFNAIF
jgi:hypothetical protein